MLDEIFNNYNNNNDNNNNDNIKESNNNNNSNNINYLSREIENSNKIKVNNILNKYCTLYNKDKSIQPMNIEYLNKKARREQNKNNAGFEWFNMEAPELTPELKQDLKALQLGKFIDPSTWRRKSDRKGYGKFFQVGTIKDNIIDGKINRLRKYEVKSRIAEEVLNNDLINNYSLKKFNEYQEQRKKYGLKKSKLNKFKLQTKGKKKGGVVAK